MKDGRHTRRWIALLAVGTLLWVLAGTRSVARSEQATRSSTALDLVILIDDSNSMYDTPGGPKGSDPEKYRREAAIIMLNMCETKSSRAAVISFGSRPRELVPDGMSYDTTNSFIQFKITEPCENGTWHLVFQSDAATIANNAKPAASITVLFSYDLELNASLVAADGAHTLDAVAKNDTLEINAWFVDPDGQRSKDRMLYQSAQPDANTPEAGIRAYAYALPADSAASSDVNGAKENAIRLEPTQAGEGGFSSVCRLADLGITRAGAYRLYLRAQGEGLARDLQEPIAFTVVNQPPAFAQDGDITLTINNPADEVMNPHMEKTVCLDEDGLCEDADAPVDTLSLSARSEDTGIVRVEEDANRKDDRVTLTAVRSGETNVVLTANDGDTGDAVQKTVPVRVVDVGLSLANRYEPEIIVENTPGEDGAYAINDTLRLRLHVRDKEVSGVDRDGYLLTPSLTLTEENGAVTELPLTETPGGEGWSASLPPIWRE